MAVLAIDFGATQLRGALISENGDISEERFEDSRVEEGKEKTIDRLRNFIHKYIEEFPHIEAVGVAVPGPVDYLSGTVLNPPNLPGWQVVALQEELSAGLKIPLLLDRDSNVALLGERWQGEAKETQNAALITWGTGVGGALLIEGFIYRGNSGLAGEIGHMIIDQTGPECNLGHGGCLESYIGGKAVTERTGKSLEEIAKGARSGNEEDKKLASEIGLILQSGLTNIVTLLDPEIIIMDGSVVQSIDIFLPEIEDYPVRASQLATKAGLLGAGRMAWDYLEDNI